MLLAKKLISNNCILKILSLIVGYSIWAYLGQHYSMSQEFTIPVAVYNANQKNIALDTQQIKVLLNGTRHDLRTCSKLAMHINANEYALGTHHIIPNPEQLLLPESVKLVQSKPYKVTLQATTA